MDRLPSNGALSPLGARLDQPRTASRAIGEVTYAPPSPSSARVGRPSISSPSSSDSSRSSPAYESAYRLNDWSKAYEVTIEEQEVDEISRYRRRLESLLMRSMDDKIPSEASGLFDMRQSGIENCRTIKRNVRERCRAYWTGLMVMLPLVEVVSISQRQDRPVPGDIFSRYIAARRIVRNRKRLSFSRIRALARYTDA